MHKKSYTKSVELSPKKPYLSCRLRFCSCNMSLSCFNCLICDDCRQISLEDDCYKKRSVDFKLVHIHITEKLIPETEVCQKSVLYKEYKIKI